MGDPVAAKRSRLTPTTRLVVFMASAVVFGLLPLVALYDVFAAIAGNRVTPDFSLTYYRAAEALLDGERIYPTGELVLRGDFIIDYLYPPLTAIAAAPFTLLPVGAAELLFAGLLVLAFAATLAVLGVRDWRCYGLAFLWPPVLDAIQTENVTILLGLAAALVWRLRDRSLASGATLGVSLALKIVMWPLAIWLAATRRLAAMLWAFVIATALLTITWVAIGFEGLSDYPDLLRRASEIQDGESYTVYALALDLGSTPGLARALWILLAVTLLAATVIVGRRGDERRAFVLAIAATIACSPIVWLHYFALLLVAVAVAEPRLAPAWFLGLPLQVFISTGVHNGSTFQTAAMLATAALTVVLVLRRPSLTVWRRDRSAPRPVAGSP
ncbi:MAG: glycosyltransferase family 87 protein [Gaiellaceae bacterium]